VPFPILKRLLFLVKNNHFRQCYRNCLKISLCENRHHFREDIKECTLSKRSRKIAQNKNIHRNLATFSFLVTETFCITVLLLLASRRWIFAIMKIVFILSLPSFSRLLKVHKIEIFFGFDFEICIISLLVMSKY
jgi:hypothetical protein